jgi:hypothetical protein
MNEKTYDLLEFGIWDLFGSIGIWNLGFFRLLNS